MAGGMGYLLAPLRGYRQGTADANPRVNKTRSGVTVAAVCQLEMGAHCT